MRRYWAIAKATALEIMSEPLSLLVLIAGMSLTVLAPAFHYHQFGEPTRMARDAAISAILVAGSVFGVFGVIRSFRRELETGTASVAVATSVSRSGFFLAKTFGGFLAFGVFLIALVGVSLTVVNAARIGGAIASESGDIVRPWGPSLACALGSVILPVVIAAALNRLVRCRFCLSAFALTAFLGGASAAYEFDLALCVRFLPVAIVAASVPAVLLSVAAVAGAFLRANAAGTLVGLVALAFLPFAGNHCLSDSPSVDGSVDGKVAWVALGSAALASLAFVTFGAAAVGERDMA